MKYRKNNYNACILKKNLIMMKNLVSIIIIMTIIFSKNLSFLLKSSYFYFTGPRACPGESLAKTEMFLVFSNLIQKFRFSKVSVDDVLDFSGITGITTCASPYRLKVESRHDWQQTDTDKTDTGNKLTLAPNNYWQKIDTNNNITLMSNWYWQQTDPYSKLKLTTNWDWQQIDTDDELTLTNWHWQQYVLLANWLKLILTGILTIESGTDNKLGLKLNLCGNKLFQNGILTH